MKRKELLMLSGICTLGFIIRVIWLGADSYWFDEANTIGFTQWPLRLFFEHYYVQRPAYFLILRLWVNFFGNGEFITRLLSVIFGSLSILALYKFTGLFLNRKIALFAAFLLAVSFFHGLWSRAVMNYAFFSLISILSSFYFLKYVKFDRKIDLIFYCIFTIINIFVHPFALYLVLTQNILVFFWNKKLFNFRWVVAKFFIFTAIALLLWAIFFHPSFEETYKTRIREINYAPPDIFRQRPYLSFYPLLELYEAFTFGGREMGHGGDGFHVLEWTLPLGYILLFIYTILLFSGLKRILNCHKEKKNISRFEQPGDFQRISLLYILLSLFIPIGITFIVQFWINPILCERYFLFSYHFLLIILSIGLYEGIKLLRVRRLIILAISILSIIYSINLYIPAYHQTWRDIAAIVEKNIKDEDAIVLIPFGQITSFWFYFERDNKKVLHNKTMDGIYKDGEWLHSFTYDAHPVVGNAFGRIDDFVQEKFFKKFYSEERNIWLVMSPFWEEVDRAADKVYKEIKRDYRRVFNKYYPFNGVSVEKWIMERKNNDSGS